MTAKEKARVEKFRLYRYVLPAPGFYGDPVGFSTRARLAAEQFINRLRQLGWESVELIGVESNQTVVPGELDAALQLGPPSVTAVVMLVVRASSPPRAVSPTYVTPFRISTLRPQIDPLPKFSMLGFIDDNLDQNSSFYWRTAQSGGGIPVPTGQTMIPPVMYVARVIHDSDLLDFEHLTVVTRVNTLDPFQGIDTLDEFLGLIEIEDHLLPGSQMVKLLNPDESGDHGVKVTAYHLWPCSDPQKIADNTYSFVPFAGATASSQALYRMSTRPPLFGEPDEFVPDETVSACLKGRVLLFGACALDRIVATRVASKCFSSVPRMLL